MVMSAIYIDPVGGNDSNTGADATHQWKTLAKLQSYMAKATMTIVVDVYLATGTFSENFTIDWSQPGEQEDATELRVHGTKTTSYSGTTTTGTCAWVPGVVGSGGIYGILADTSVPTGAWSTSGLVGEHFQVTSGPNSGQVGVIISEVPGHSTQAYYLPTQNSGVPTNGMMSVGVTYTVYTKTKIAGRFEPGPMTNVYLEHLTFQTSSNVVENTAGCGVLSTYGCHFKGDFVYVGSSYWLTQACHFELTGKLEVSGGGFLDQWGNLFNGGYLLVANGGATDCYGHTVVSNQLGVSNPNLSLTLTGNYRIPFGTPSSWLCFLETPGTAVYVQSGSSITCESERIWGHLTGTPICAIGIIEGGQIFYNGLTSGANAPIQLTGATHLLDIAGQVFDTVPVDAPPHGCMWDLGLPSHDISSAIVSLASLSHCVLLLDASLGVTTSGGTVSAWADQSSSTCNVTQATPSKQPTYNATDASYGNQTTFSFTAANLQKLVSSVNIALAQPCTWYIVGECNSAVGGFVDGVQAIYGNGNSPRQLGMYAGSTYEGVPPVNVPSVICCEFNSARSQGWVNQWDAAHASPLSGDAVTSSLTPGTGTQGIVTVGGGSVTNPLNGKVALVAAFIGRHTVAQRQQAMQYLGARYSIVVGS